MGRHRRAPADPHLPSAGRTPARCARPRDQNPSEIPSPDYDVVVFENRFPSFAGSRRRAAADRPAGCSTPGRATAAARWCASPPTTTRLLSALPAAPDAHRHRGLGGPHRRAVRAARCRAGLLLREPGRGDRCHPGPPARPDLRLPVRHPEDGRRDPVGAGVPGAHRRQPVRRPARRRDRRRLPHRRPERALGGVRAVRRPLAGRGAPVPADARSAT